MHKVIALLIVFFIISSIPGNLDAKERRGAYLEIQKKDGRLVKGYLLAVKNKTLMLKDDYSPVEVSVDISEIKLIVKRTEIETASLVGAGIGFIAGAVPAIQISRKRGYAPRGYIVLTALYGGLSALLGYTIGSMVSSKDKTILIEGMTEAEILRIIDKLRKKAKMPSIK